MNKKIVVLGGRGHIGAYVAHVLSRDGHDVTTYDIQTGTDLSDISVVRQSLTGAGVVIDTLPYTCNRLIATVAARLGVAYFNLTEDVENTTYIRGLAAQPNIPLIPQCGLAPGMVSIIAQQMTRAFATVDSIYVRVGALPCNKLNHLGYALTWSAAGLVNEYCNPCAVVQNGVLTTAPALDGQETLVLHGEPFEAAYTSGGIGTLAETWAGVAREVNYKTLRYAGHFDFMRILRDDLQMAQYKNLAEDWFTRALPRTVDDVVVIAIHVTGVRSSRTRQSSGDRYTSTYVHRVYRDSEPTLARSGSTAIQKTTAHGVLAVVDTYLRGHLSRTGFVKQEDIPFEAIYDSPYSETYGLSDICLPTSDTNQSPGYGYGV